MVTSTFILGILQMAISIVDLFSNIEYPTIQVKLWSEIRTNENLQMTIKLKNYGNQVFVNKVIDIKLQLNPNDRKNFPYLWEKDKVFILCMREDYVHMPHDLNVKLIIKDSSKHSFMCRVYKDKKDKIVKCKINRVPSFIK